MCQAETRNKQQRPHRALTSADGLRAVSSFSQKRMHQTESRTQLTGRRLASCSHSCSHSCGSNQNEGVLCNTAPTLPAARSVCMTRTALHTRHTRQRAARQGRLRSPAPQPAQRRPALRLPPASPRTLHWPRPTHEGFCPDSRWPAACRQGSMRLNRQFRSAPAAVWEGRAAQQTHTRAFGPAVPATISFMQISNTLQALHTALPDQN
jgi:hypothetical protein